MRKLNFDRIFPGVGRLKLSSQQPDTTDGRKRFKKMNQMLTDLYEDGRHEYLVRLKKGELTPLQLWSAYRSHALDKLPTAELMREAWVAMERWANTSPTGKHNRNQRHEAISLLSALSPNATVGDLVDVMQRYQQRATDTPSMFNHVKTHVQRFVAQTLGKAHPLYLQLVALDRLRVEKKRKRGLALLEAKAVWSSEAVSEPARLAFRALCLTGMRPSEYLQDRWQVLQDRIEVYGTKTSGSDRIVPLVSPITLIRIPLPALRYQLGKFPEAVVEPYTARRTFAVAMEEARIPRARRRMYLGHGVKDVSDLYERQEMTANLLEDGKRLREWWGLEGLRLMEASK